MFSNASKTGLGTYVGTVDEGSMYLVVELRQRGDAVSPRRTIDHEPIAGYSELSIVGTWKGKGGAESGGQNRDDLAALIDHGEPFAGNKTDLRGWTREELAEVLAIWDRWHLNGMKAACTHMPADAHQLFEQHVKVPCEAGWSDREDGRVYTYGEAWLVEELPAEIVTRLGSLFGHLAGYLYDLAEELANQR